MKVQRYCINMEPSEEFEVKEFETKIIVKDDSVIVRNVYPDNIKTDLVFDNKRSLNFYLEKMVESLPLRD